MLEKLLARIDELEHKFHREPFSYVMEQIKAAKIEFAIYVLKKPELIALLRAFEAEPKESEKQETIRPIPPETLEKVKQVKKSPGRPKKVKS
jgi:hypothetical protein